MADNRPIGAFDSGLGGLSVVKELVKLLPNENIVYFGDTGRVPYGTKSIETVNRYAKDDEAFLLSKNVKMVIAACGTVSSVAVSTGKLLPVPFVEVVTPAALEAAKKTVSKKIGVLGTNATVNSGSFRNAINAVLPSASITSVACPLFVSLVESGWIDRNDEVTVLTAKRYLKPLIDAGVDTVILGCTHFPVISEIISDIMGKDVTLINTGKCAAMRVKELLENEGLLSDGKNTGRTEYYVSDRSENFSDIASVLLGHDIKNDVHFADASGYGEKNAY